MQADPQDERRLSASYTVHDCYCKVYNGGFSYGVYIFIAFFSDFGRNGFVEN